MALNFPLDTSAPYIDPVSGLKYIYNTAVGAWEPAIQPPIIYSAAPTPPDIQIEGFLWYDGSNLYIYHNNAWQLAGGGGSGGGGGNVTVGDAAPATPAAGDLWWSSEEGRLFIFYTDIDSSQWVDASPNITGSNGSNVFSGPNAPGTAVEGALWYNTTTGQLYVFTSGSWQQTQNAISGVASLKMPHCHWHGNQSYCWYCFCTNRCVGCATSGGNQCCCNWCPDPRWSGNGIGNYLPQASEIVRGVIELATIAVGVK